jgi:hypothetical protein
MVMGNNLSQMFFFFNSTLEYAYRNTHNNQEGTEPYVLITYSVKI